MFPMFQTAIFTNELSEELSSSSSISNTPYSMSFSDASESPANMLQIIQADYSFTWLF